MEGSSKPPKLIGEFLTELTEDEELQKRFRADPDGTLAQSGLTKEQQGVLRSGNLRQIRDAVRSEYGQADVMLFLMFFFAAGGSDPYGSKDS